MSGYTYFCNRETGESVWSAEETWNSCDRVSKEPGLKLSDLECIRARITGKLDSPDKLQGTGITINDRRGEWLMIFDEETNNTVFYNPSTGQIREDRPKGWVRLLASRFNKG